MKNLVITLYFQSKPYTNLEDLIIARFLHPYNFACCMRVYVFIHGIWHVSESCSLRADLSACLCLKSIPLSDALSVHIYIYIYIYIYAAVPKAPGAYRDRRERCFLSRLLHCSQGSQGIGERGNNATTSVDPSARSGTGEEMMIHTLIPENRWSTCACVHSLLRNARLGGFLALSARPQCCEV